MGFAFYVLAGFTTTYRGGPAFRGAWAGYWAGITSTGMFWFVLGVGLLIRVSQYMQSSYGRGSVFRDILNNAWAAVSPHFPDYIFISSQPAWVNLLVLLFGGLIVAFGLGAVGGILGKMRNQAKMARRQYP
jgi:hypothetical protein